MCMYACKTKLWRIWSYGLKIFYKIVTKIKKFRGFHVSGKAGKDTEFQKKKMETQV